MVMAAPPFAVPHYPTLCRHRAPPAPWNLCCHCVPSPCEPIVSHPLPRPVLSSCAHTPNPMLLTHVLHPLCAITLCPPPPPCCSLPQP